MKSKEKRNISEYDKMTKTPVLKLVALLSLPTMTSQMITSIYNMADAFFVSKLSTSASGAVSVVFAIQTIIQALGYGFATGAGSIISRRLGQKKTEEANVYLNSAFLSAIVAGILILITFSINLEGWLRILGATETILPYAKDYVIYLLLAAPVMASSFVLNLALKAEGKATFTMIAMMSGGFLNMILDPILIFGFKLGIAGASIATLASQCLSFSIMFVFFLKRRSMLTLSPKFISRHFAHYKEIISTGMPTVFRQGLACVATTLLNLQVKPFGDSAIAAVGNANKVYMLLRNMLLGIGQGFQPVAGFNYGAGIKKRVKQSFWSAVFLGSCISVVSALVALIFPKVIMSAFIPDDPEFIQIGSTMLRIMSAALPFLAFSTFVNQLYQGLGFSKCATLLASCRQGIFFVPLILILPSQIGILGIQLTQTLADLLTVLFSIPFCIYFIKHVLKEDKNVQINP